MLLERNRTALDNASSFGVENGTVQNRGSNLFCEMICRIHCVHATNSTTFDGDSKRQTSVHFDVIRSETDPFPDSLILHSVTSEQGDEIEAALADIKSAQLQKGLSEKHLETLAMTTNKLEDILRTSFSSSPLCTFPPLKIETTTLAKPVQVHLQNYLREQNIFLNDFLDDPVRHCMAYVNSSATRTSTPLLVSKSRRAYFVSLSIFVLSIRAPSGISTQLQTSRTST